MVWPMAVSNMHDIDNVNVSFNTNSFVGKVKKPTTDNVQGAQRNVFE